MNKKLLAVALATAFAAPAMAEGVQIYGAFDVGVLVRGGSEDAVGDARDTRYQLGSGMNGHNFIGFKMSEDLGNGLTLSGDAQFAFNLDSGEGALQGSALRTITSTLALSGDFGTVVAGRTGGARAAWIKKYDPFGGFGVAGALAVTGGGVGGGEDYANNVVAWVTPELGLTGLKGLLAYTSTLDSQDVNTKVTGSSDRLYAIALMYDNGPLSFVLNHEKLTLIGNGEGTNDLRVYTAGASYDFGVAKVYGLYDGLTNAGTGWQVGVSAPVSEKTTAKMGYVTTKVRGGTNNEAECSKVGVGLTHDLSKRTRFYTDAAYLTQAEAGTGCANQGGINTYGGTHGSAVGGTGFGTGYGQWGFDAGIRHSF